MRSSEKRDRIAIEVILIMERNPQAVVDLKKALQDKNSDLSKAINQKRITPLTLFGRDIKCSLEQCHSAQEMDKTLKVDKNL